MEEEPRFNQEQYDLLLKCAETGDMTDWNPLREEHPDIEIWLEGADFSSSFPNGAKLSGAKLTKALFRKSNLRNAVLIATDIQDSCFLDTDLRGAKFIACGVNNDTRFHDCTVDRNTNFSHTAIDTCHIDPTTKALLKCNIRRLNWEDWYKNTYGFSGLGEVSGGYLITENHQNGFLLLSSAYLSFSPLYILYSRVLLQASMTIHSIPPSPG